MSAHVARDSLRHCVSFYYQLIYMYMCSNRTRVSPLFATSFSPFPDYAFTVAIHVPYFTPGIAGNFHQGKISPKAVAKHCGKKFARFIFAHAHQF